MGVASLSRILSHGGLGVVLFVSTNLDDLFVLLLFFASPSFRKSEVIAGQFLGNFVLVLASIALASAAELMPKTLLGLLGLVPVIIGLALLFSTNTTTDISVETRPSRTGLLAVAAVTIANGGDNVAVYVPVFAVNAWPGIFAIVGVFVLMTALWCWFAQYLVKHPQLGPPLRRYGHRFLPWVLITIGLDVMWTSFAGRASTLLN